MCLAKIYVSTYDRITVFLHVDERYYTLYGFKEIMDWRNKRWEEHSKEKMKQKYTIIGLETEKSEREEDLEWDTSSADHVMRKERKDKTKE